LFNGHDPGWDDITTWGECRPWGDAAKAPATVEVTAGC
jgi:hypothetical protein